MVMDSVVILIPIKCSKPFSVEVQILGKPQYDLPWKTTYPSQYVKPNEKYLEKGVKRLEIVGAEAVEIYPSRSSAKSGTPGGLSNVERQDGVD
jgi:hypothetical protein